jgi:lysophospholipase L1-like esterase
MARSILIIIIFTISSSITSRGAELIESVKITIRSTTSEKRKKRDARWWMKRHKLKLTEKASLGDVKLVFLGDSITHAWDKYKSEWDKHFAKYKALNLGYSGDRTENVLWRLDNGEVDGVNPKVLVMMIGTNNAGLRKEKSQDTALGIKAILQKLRKKLPETKVLILAIFPRGRNDHDEYRKLTMETNEIIKTYADEKNIFFMNINNIFLDHDRVLHKNVMRDFLHPNESMYPKWAEAIVPKIEELMQ